MLSVSGGGVDVMKQSSSPGTGGESTVVVLAQLHGILDTWLGPPGGANTLQRPPLRHLLRKYGTHCSLNQTHSILEFQIASHPAPVMYYKLYGCSGLRRRLKSLQEAVIIRTVNTVVAAGLEHKTALPGLSSTSE